MQFVILMHLIWKKLVRFEKLIFEIRGNSM